MNIFEHLFSNTEIPKLYPVRFSLPRGNIQRKEIDSIIHSDLNQRQLHDRIQPGMSVAIAVGSREITNIDQIAKTVVNYVKSRGAVPFIFPAMGSHGGATASGQLEILAGYNVTEKSMGCPIKSSMETVLISTAKNGLPVHIDHYAAQADAIIPIGRIKPAYRFSRKI